MSVVNCPNPLTRRREYLRSPISRKVGGPLKAMSFLMSTQAGFSPADIASLAHWYDATEISGSDGNAIGTWADQEGSADLSQSTTSKKPTLKTNVINGNQVVRGDGSDDRMTASFTSLSQPNHIFMVGTLRSADDSSSRTAYDSTSSSARNLLNAEDASNLWSIFAGTELTGSGDNTNNHIFTALYNGASSSLRVDGSSDASGDAGTNSMDGLSIFADQSDGAFGPWDIGELLIYDASLSTSDRNEVESYLSDKWGIAI